MCLCGRPAAVCDVQGDPSAAEGALSSCATEPKHSQPRHTHYTQVCEVIMAGHQQQLNHLLINSTSPNNGGGNPSGGEQTEAMLSEMGRMQNQLDPNLHVENTQLRGQIQALLNEVAVLKGANTLNGGGGGGQSEQTQGSANAHVLALEAQLQATQTERAYFQALLEEKQNLIGRLQKRLEKQPVRNVLPTPPPPSVVPKKKKTQPQQPYAPADAPRHQQQPHDFGGSGNTTCMEGPVTGSMGGEESPPRRGFRASNLQKSGATASSNSSSSSSSSSGGNGINSGNDCTTAGALQGQSQGSSNKEGGYESRSGSSTIPFPSLPSSSLLSSNPGMPPPCPVDLRAGTTTISATSASTATTHLPPLSSPVIGSLTAMLYDEMQLQKFNHPRQTIQSCLECVLALFDIPSTVQDLSALCAVFEQQAEAHARVEEVLENLEAGDGMSKPELDCLKRIFDLVLPPLPAEGGGVEEGGVEEGGRGEGGGGGGGRRGRDFMRELISALNKFHGMKNKKPDLAYMCQRAGVEQQGIHTVASLREGLKDHLPLQAAFINVCASMPPGQQSCNRRYVARKLFEFCGLDASVLVAKKGTQGRKPPSRKRDGTGGGGKKKVEAGVEEWVRIERPQRQRKKRRWGDEDSEEEREVVVEEDEEEEEEEDEEESLRISTASEDELDDEEEEEEEEEERKGGGQEGLRGKEGEEGGGGGGGARGARGEGMTTAAAVIGLEGGREEEEVEKTEEFKEKEEEEEEEKEQQERQEGGGEGGGEKEKERLAASVVPAAMVDQQEQVVEAPPPAGPAAAPQPVVGLGTAAGEAAAAPPPTSGGAGEAIAASTQAKREEGEEGMEARVVAGEGGTAGEEGVKERGDGLQSKAPEVEGEVKGEGVVESMNF